jgi:hypothetical protein
MGIIRMAGCQSYSLQELFDFNEQGALGTLTSPKGIGIYFIIYKNSQIYINGNLIIKIKKRNARKLNDGGYEAFLNPCKMAFDSLWNEP